MINDVLGVFEIIILFLLFGILHTVLASKKIKLLIEEKAGEFIAFYRIGYIIISLLSFYALYSIIPKLDLTIYDLKYPFDFLIIIPQLIALAGIFWTLKYFCIKEFLGINQIIRWMKSEYDMKDIDEHTILVIEGPYKYIRHPLYLFSIIFLVCRPSMNLSDATLFLCIVAYFYIGSFYEEKKLIDKFGKQYLEYQNLVPRLIPFVSGNRFYL